MSEAHIPQPNSQSAAPAEAFDSTADAPHGPTVSGIGVPAGPPQEISPHTGAANTFDITIHRQFIPIDTVVWSVTQTKGTLLWFRPIHPKYCNDLTAYLQEIYNCWGGGIEFNFKVAGTGFHAGALAMVRIPPNRHPNEFLTASSWGAFEYVVIDPKMLEVSSLDVSDQRPIAYHYQPFDSSNSYTFGGWIAMYVLIPLNTSATGSQQIAVQVFSRPGPSFNFSQLIMPGIQEVQEQFPGFYNRYFDFTTQDELSNGRVNCVKLVIEPASVQQTDKVNNCKKVDGTQMSKWSPNFVYPAYMGKTYSVQQKAIVHRNDTLVELRFMQGYVPQLVPKADAYTVLYRENGAVDAYSTAWTELDQGGVYTWTNPTPASGSGWEGQVIGVNTSGWTESALANTAYSPKAANESIIHFTNGSSSDPLSCVQTIQISLFLASKALAPFFTDGMCLLFLLIDKTEDLPVGYVKLYQEGLFTARASTTQTLFPIENMKLVFDSFILRTALIPSNATYNANRVLLGQHRRFVSRSKTVTNG
nr:MAG: capsid protein [Wufeng shrew picorna-like virus 55]